MSDEEMGYMYFQTRPFDPEKDLPPIAYQVYRLEQERDKLKQQIEFIQNSIHVNILRKVLKGKDAHEMFIELFSLLFRERYDKVKDEFSDAIDMNTIVNGDTNNAG